MYTVGDTFMTMSHTPKYVQVKEEIRRRIRSKEWTAGCRIPVESEFCEMFGVSRITVRKALEELQMEGYLVKIQGKGTFVREQTVEQRLCKFYSFSEELRRQGIQEQARVMELSSVSADADLANHLQIVVGEQVHRVYRIRCTEHGPYAVETSYIPVNFAPAISKDMINENGLYKTLEAHGVVVDSARETIKAIRSEEHTSELPSLGLISYD